MNILKNWRRKLARNRQKRATLIKPTNHDTVTDSLFYDDDRTYSRSGNSIDSYSGGDSSGGSCGGSGGDSGGCDW